MSDHLLSVGLDIGTTTTQMVVSMLRIENKGSSFHVPQMEIIDRQILYKSPIHFTPLLGQNLVDGDKLRQLIEEEYRSAHITPQQVDTGAVIITGETSRKENARAVLQSLADYAGDFVVATAGPHLESILSAKGAGADHFSKETGKTVLHIDIGGGTSNLALIRRGKIVATGCMNVGGRLVKLDEDGCIIYRSAVLDGYLHEQVGQSLAQPSMQALCDTLTQALEMAVGLRPVTSLLEHFWTTEAGFPWEIPTDVEMLSFSGGVSECIDHAYMPFSFGDLGPTLGQSIAHSLLCRKEYRLCPDSIRATVIGAGCHSTQLSGSTIFQQNMSLPIKNLPVIALTEEEQCSPDLHQLITKRLALHENDTAIALPGFHAAHYHQITTLAEQISKVSFPGAVIIVLQQDMAKALGHALALRLPKSSPILCIDSIHLSAESYLDIGAEVGAALPVVIKTLILEK